MKKLKKKLKEAENTEIDKIYTVNYVWMSLINRIRLWVGKQKYKTENEKFQNLCSIHNKCHVMLLEQAANGCFWLNIGKTNIAPANWLQFQVGHVLVRGLTLMLRKTN